MGREITSFFCEKSLHQPFQKKDGISNTVYMQILSRDAKYDSAMSEGFATKALKYLNASLDRAQENYSMSFWWDYKGLGRPKWAVFEKVKLTKYDTNSITNRCQGSSITIRMHLQDIRLNGNIWVTKFAKISQGMSLGIFLKNLETCRVNWKQ
jgi:hypothetical protein